MLSSSLAVDERIGQEADLPQEELDYLQGRAEAELEMAQRCESPEATAAHYQLAEAYLERIGAQMEAAKGEEGSDAQGTAEAASAPPECGEAERPSASGPEGR